MASRRTRRRGFIFVPTLLFLVYIAISPTLCFSEEMAIIPMQYRTAVEVLPMVNGMLSPKGRAVADPRTNTLLIEDDAETVKKIKDAVSGLDQLGKQSRIRVKFIEEGTSESSRVEGEARASKPGWAITTDPRKRTDGVDVRLQDRSRGREGISEYFVNVVSGSPAYIMVGKDILYSQRWIDLTRRHARVVETVGIQRIETGFEVLPVMLKDHADIEVTPRISHEAHSGAGGGVIRFSELATRVYAPLNQWVSIGGADQSSSEVMREILGRGRSSQVSSLSILLMVEAQ